MFEYDSACDQFKEVLSDNEEPIIDSNNSTLNIVPSLRSSRSSLRSLKRLIYIPRLISKTGRLNTYFYKLPNKHVVYFRDLGNTLLNTRWRWILLTVFIINFITFIIFGMVWMWLAIISGDYNESSTEFCIVNTKSFVGYLLLSVETITTIGYGYRYPTEKCRHVWLALVLQSFVSVAIQGALVSAVYVKIAKPFTKDPLSLFSKKAVVSMQDGKFCLMIRITDRFGKISVGTTINMYYINKTTESEDFLHIKQIKIQPYGFLIFPIEIVHIIDISSPFWNMSPVDFLTKKFEVIAVAEGTSKVTGQLSQNRTSYTPSDVLWGYRFSCCVHFDNRKNKYFINQKEINETMPFNAPLCSAKEYHELKLQYDEPMCI